MKNGKGRGGLTRAALLLAGVHFWTPVGLQNRAGGGSGFCKSLRNFGGPGEIRTHDLFHAI